MSDAFAMFLWEHLQGVVYAGIAVAGVSALVLVTISNFKDLFDFQGRQT